MSGSLFMSLLKPWYIGIKADHLSWDMLFHRSNHLQTTIPTCHWKWKYNILLCPDLLSQFSFFRQKYFSAGCLFLTHEIKISTETMSWSTKLGRMLTFRTRNGTLVNTKSKILFSLVGLVTT